MIASDLKLFCFGKFFVWTPPGYAVFGFLHKGHNYALLSLKSSQRYNRKVSMKSLGQFNFLNVEREIKGEE